MKNVSIRVFSVGLAIALLTAPVAAFAQPQTPVREGNIWNWQDHQPTEALVQRDEKAAGIAPTPSQEASDAATLNEINHQLLH
jgi:hypothetical protein